MATLTFIQRSLIGNATLLSTRWMSSGQKPVGKYSKYARLHSRVITAEQQAIFGGAGSGPANAYQEWTSGAFYQHRE